MNFTYFECVPVALFIQHIKDMRSIVLSSVTSLALPYFSTLSHKRHDFRERKLLNIKFVFLMFSTSLSEHFSS